MGAKKKITLFLILISLTSSVFAQAYSEYQKYLSKAKEYESQKRWIYALDAYYDAMGTDELPKNKQEAYDGYKKLADAIESGNPGLGKFDKFSLHDEWKNLLIDAEKYGSSFNPCEVTIGNLIQGNLDYKKKTASYNAEISIKLGDRYNKTILPIINGFKKAYKNDWNDLPNDWPKFPAKYGKTGEVSEDSGVYYDDSEERGSTTAFSREEPLVYTYESYPRGWLVYRLYNAFFATYNNHIFIECEFNICNEKGKALLKNKRYLLPTTKGTFTITDISPELMNLIDSGKAFLNPIACYLKYGCIESRFGSDLFTEKIEDLSEIQLSMEKSVFICWKNKTDKKAINVNSTFTEGIKRKLKAQRDKEDEPLIEKILALEPSYNYVSMELQYGTSNYGYNRKQYIGFDKNMGEFISFYTENSELSTFNSVNYELGSQYNYPTTVNDEVREYAILNKASKKAGYSPCYYQEQDGNHVFDPDKWELGKWSNAWENSESIKKDENANGFSYNYQRYIVRNDSIELAIQKKKYEDAIKSYFEKILKHEKLDDTESILTFYIPLDDSYNSTSNKFLIKDSFGKTWSISQTEFLSKLKEISGKKYEIKYKSYDTHYLYRTASTEEKTAYEKAKNEAITEAIKSYFEEISIYGKMETQSKYDFRTGNSTDFLIFKIDLDNSFSEYSSTFSLKDSSGKYWEVSKSIFLSTLKKLTNQDWQLYNSIQMSEHYLYRDANEEEKTAYERAKNEAITKAVKSYFEKISKNEKLSDTESALIYEIPLDDSYSNYYGFTLTDSTGKSWKISKSDFISKLGNIYGKAYSIHGNFLCRNASEEEKTAYERAKNEAITEAVKSYFEKISICGKVETQSKYDFRTGNSTDFLIFKIDLDNSFSEYSSTFSLKDSSGKYWEVSKSIFLLTLKKLTNQDWQLYNSIQMSEHYLYRDANEEEKILYAFYTGNLHTNLVCNVKGQWTYAMDLTEVDGYMTIKSFKGKNNIFEKSGLKTKDIIKKIFFSNEAGNEYEIKVDEIPSITAPSKLAFTVQRKNGKNISEITIEVMVTWNVNELKKIRKK